MCLLLCCLLILCECRFQRSKVLLVLVDDFENDFPLCRVRHDLQLIVKLCTETSRDVFQCHILVPYFFRVGITVIDRFDFQHRHIGCFPRLWRSAVCVRLRLDFPFRVQNFIHDFLPVDIVCLGKTVHIGITDFRLPGQDFLLHTGHQSFHDLHALHKLFGAGNIGFTDMVLLCNLLADACFRTDRRNCVILTQFLLNRFLRGCCILIVAVSTGLPMLDAVLLSNKELLLLRREVAPPQLILANPRNGFFAVLKPERHGGEINLRVLLENGITVVSINKGIVPDNQRREQLALFQDIFFKLLKFIIGQRRNLGLELRVDFQIDHTHTPLSLLLRRFFLPEKGRNILLCGFQFEQFLFSFLVLLVELCLFGCQRRILDFQIFRAGQLGEVICLEIGCCHPVRCQLCTVLLKRWDNDV